MSRFQSRSLSPNTMTKLVLSRQTMHREPEPYPSKCISKWEKEYQVYFNIVLSELTLTFFTSNSGSFQFNVDAGGLDVGKLHYETLLCQSFCVDDYVIDLCNCTLSHSIELNRNISGAIPQNEIKAVNFRFNLKLRFQLFATLPTLWWPVASTNWTLGVFSKTSSPPALPARKKRK